MSGPVPPPEKPPPPPEATPDLGLYGHYPTTISTTTTDATILLPPSSPRRQPDDPEKQQQRQQQHHHDQQTTTAATTTDEEEKASSDPLPLSPPPSPPRQQRWNQSPRTIYRFLSTLFAFVVLGMNDACTGALIPYIETYYSVSYTTVSLLFLTPFAGYVAAGLLNDAVHRRFGQFGVAVLGPLCKLVGYVPMACHPPYAALPVIMLIPGFGNGIEDSGWNAWIGNMHNANELLGFLHGAYGLGATIAPLVATAMVTHAGLPWYSYYYLMISLAGLEGVLLTTAFWGASGRVHREATAAAIAATGEAGAGGGATSTRRVLREPITWLVSFFLLGYVGAEVSLGGWIVTFMLRVRGAAAFDAGLTVTFFWLGLTVGRMTLGFVTGRVGEKLAITAYLLLSVALQLLYWLVPSFVASAVFVSLLGFFLGPLFPAAIVAATKLLPDEYHVSAIGFAAAVGGAGAAIFPFAVGAIAQSKGVEVLQPMVLAELAFISLMWCMLPGGLRVGGLERARENREKVGQGVRDGWRWVKSHI